MLIINPCKLIMDDGIWTIVYPILQTVGRMYFESRRRVGSITVQSGILEYVPFFFSRICSMHHHGKCKRIIQCIRSIYYRQHNKQLVIMVLRHVSTHTNHRQVTFRTFWFQQYYYLHFWRFLVDMKWWLSLYWYERNLTMTRVSRNMSL
jgi:hypothetical protein